MRTNEIQITHKGQTKTLAGWAEVTGIDRKTLDARIRILGWTLEKTLETATNDAMAKKGPSKNDAELYLNDLKFDQLPDQFQKLLKREGYTNGKWGREIRERDRASFNEWYEKIFKVGKHLQAA